MTFDEKMAEVRRKYPNLRKLPEVDCAICGYFEVYYEDRESSILVRTCPTCNYVQVIDVARMPGFNPAAND